MSQTTALTHTHRSVEDVWDLAWTKSRAPAVDTGATDVAPSNVAQSLLSLNAVMQAVAAGRLDTAVPGAERAEDIADLARTLLHLRACLADAAWLRIEQAEQTSLDDIREALANLVRQPAEQTSYRFERECEIVWRLLRATERRDNGAGSHIVRMGRISRIIAEAMGLPEAKCRMIEIAAQMHDVGKVGIADEILFKPGRLTPQERAVMETHALLGWDILHGSKSPLILLAAEIAVSHHEKWDGTGYPHRLAGEAIPLVGRISALADVFDALMATRPYKQAWTLEQATAFIMDNAASHFDPACVAAFVSRIDDIVPIIRDHIDLAGAPTNGCPLLAPVCNSWPR